MVTVLSGSIAIRFAASDPGTGVTTGHTLVQGDTFGDSGSDNKTWMRAVETPSPVNSTDVVVTRP